MRRIDRLFEIIQILRSEKRSITAQRLAARLEVSIRTVYRDIQALQVMGTPIDGEAGVGYMMGRGYDLPPINFTAEEVEAVVVGLNLLHRTGDTGLQKAAERVTAKIETARNRMWSFKVSKWGVATPQAVNPELLRQAVRQERKLRLVYHDGEDIETKRTVQPVAMIYYVQVMVLAAWCELRNDFRHFRVDRIVCCDPLNQFFKCRGDRLRYQWRQLAANG